MSGGDEKTTTAADAARDKDIANTLVVSWKPAFENGVKIISVVVNDSPLVANHSVHESPFVVPLPPPVNSKYVIEWTIEPELDHLTAIDIEVHNDVTHAFVPVDHQDNPTRGTPWSASKTADAS